MLALPAPWWQVLAVDGSLKVMEMQTVRTVLIALYFLLSAATLSAKELEVTATAYNSVPGQTQGDPETTAWGETLTPGMKAIAVSRDLLDKGLTHGVKVKIDGLPGAYVVMDKLHRRWRRRIDIYMGEDIDAAKAWGKQKVTIRW